MTDRERLIELIDNFIHTVNVIEWYSEEIDEQLADYLLANGVIVPPCKVGDTVWWVDTEFEDLIKGEVVSFSLREEGLWAYCRYKGGLAYWHLVSDYFGKTVFLTKEEAEAKLKEREGK